jgi:hypothetical protein
VFAGRVVEWWRFGQRGITLDCTAAAQRLILAAGALDEQAGAIMATAEQQQAVVTVSAV